jgi:biotin operon repressor
MNGYEIKANQSRKYRVVIIYSPKADELEKLRTAIEKAIREL